MATAAKFVQPIPIVFLAYLVPLDVDVFLSSFINFCLASNLLWSFLCFSFFLAFWPFPWQRQPFWKNQPLKGQLHMAETEQTQYVSQTLFWGYKYGRHRQFLFQIGWFLNIFFSELELLCQMNRNLMGGTYGRLCIKFPQSIMKGERHRVSPLSL